MKRRQRKALTDIRRKLIKQYHALSEVLCSRPGLAQADHREMEKAFDFVDNAILKVNQVLGLDVDGRKA